MPMPLAALEAEALKLTPEERVLLADHLLASVDSRREVEQAWALEVERRLAQAEEGSVQFIPIEEAIERARQAVA